MRFQSRLPISVALGLCVAGMPLIPIPDVDAGGFSRRSGKGVPLLLRPFDRLAKDVRRTFRCRCAGLPMLKCPCKGGRDPDRGRHSKTVIAELPHNSGRTGSEAPMPSGTDARPESGRTSARLVGLVAAANVIAHQQVEILGKDLSPEDIAILQAAAFRVVAVRHLTFLQSSLTRLSAPPASTSGDALALARRLRPGRNFESNNLYFTARARFQSAENPCGRACEALAVTQWEPQYGRCAAGGRIGVIDTAVDETHPALRRSRVQILSTRSDDRAPSSAEHGTGIVSLLVGELGGDFTALVPGANVVAIDAFHSSTNGDAADTFDLLAALDVLGSREIDVINMSFSGPENRFLRAAIERVRMKGAVLVAAAGGENDAPNTGFPARYPDVVAVSSIDENLAPVRGSVHGQHIAYAAPGWGISVAMPESRFALADGSSFAASFVTAAYAMAMRLVNDRDQATRLITSGVRDLGNVGRDETFGWGLVQYPAIPPCRSEETAANQ